MLGIPICHTQLIGDPISAIANDSDDVAFRALAVGAYTIVGFAASEFSPKAVRGLDKVAERKDYKRV